MVKKHSKKTKQKISKKAQGRTITKSTKKKISKALKGREYSKETREKIGKSKRKNKHPLWKGGIKCQKGRVLIRIGVGKYEYRSRLVMEHYLGRKLKSNEIVHHINEDTLDDRIENLMLTNRKEHVRIHHIGAKRSEETKRKIGQASKGRTHTEETKRKISRTLKRKNNNNENK